MPGLGNNGRRSFSPNSISRFGGYCGVIASVVSEIQPQQKIVPIQSSVVKK
jgi:hypothetical protein